MNLLSTSANWGWSGLSAELCSVSKAVIRTAQQGNAGHVANRLQGALAREVCYLTAEDVLSAADVDDALSWGPGLRRGIKGNVMLNHLGGGPGGIEHFDDGSKS